MQLLLNHIRQLVTVSADHKPFRSGKEMREVGVIEDAAVLIENGFFRWVGPAKNFEGEVERDSDTIDASDSVALPGFVDAHTHLVFAGSRENEFAMRTEGTTYEEIAHRGGGIASTVQATRAAGKKELKKIAGRRLDAMLQYGTTTVEIKSGYGLSEDSEMKILEAINELKNEHPMTVVSTFLGAHAFPQEFKERPEEYVNLVSDRMLPYVARKKLADFCDAFCDRGYFTVDQARRILQKAKDLGLKLKIHADELAQIGASLLAAELGVTSADHLEHIHDDGIQKIKASGAVAVLLPGVSFFLNHQHAPARTLIDAGVPVAIASDFNPGSCMSFSMPLMMTIACTQMRMTPEEVITASTLNAAAALGLSGQVGSIEVGKQADMILCNIPNYRFLPYHFGANLVSSVIKKGTILEF